MFSVNQYINKLSYQLLLSVIAFSVGLRFTLCRKESQQRYFPRMWIKKVHRISTLCVWRDKLLSIMPSPLLQSANIHFMKWTHCSSDAIKLYFILILAEFLSLHKNEYCLKKRGARRMAYLGWYRHHSGTSACIL